MDLTSPRWSENITLNISPAQSARLSLELKTAIMNTRAKYIVIIIIQINLHNDAMAVKRQY